MTGMGHAIFILAIAFALVLIARWAGRHDYDAMSHNGLAALLLAYAVGMILVVLVALTAPGLPMP